MFRQLGRLRHSSDVPERARIAGTVRLITASGPTEWEELIEAQPGVTPFHRWGFLSEQCALFGWRFDPLIVWRGNERIGALPVLLRPAVPRMSASPPFPYIGPLLRPEDLPAAVHALRRKQWRSAVIRVRMSFRPAMPSLHSALRSAGLQPMEDRTLVVDLSHGSLEQLVAGYTPSRRAALRRADRRGVTVRPSLPGEIESLLPRLLEESYGNRGEASPFPAGIAETAGSLLRAADNFYAFTGLVDGAPAGVLLTLDEGDSAYGWLGGALREHSSRHVNSALHHADLSAALQRGRSRFDLVGYVDEGIADWKRSFGAKEVQYLQATSDLLPTWAVRLTISLRARLHGPTYRRPPTRPWRPKRAPRTTTPGADVRPESACPAESAMSGEGGPREPEDASLA